MKQQRGISLIVVLIGLVIISFAAVALLRSTVSATLIAGNLGFKKAALASGDAGSEDRHCLAQWQCRWHLRYRCGSGSQMGYYASSRDGCDLTGTRAPTTTDDDVDWAGGSPAGRSAMCRPFNPNPQPAGGWPGYTVNYVVNRMCNAAGNPSSVLAAKWHYRNGLLQCGLQRRCRRQHQRRPGLFRLCLLRFLTHLLPHHYPNRRATQHRALLAGLGSALSHRKQTCNTLSPGSSASLPGSRSPRSASTQRGWLLRWTSPPRRWSPASA